MDTDPNLRRSGREGAGADLIAHTGGGRSGQGGRRAAWRHQILSMETSSSIAKGTIQCLHFEILVMKDLLRSWPPARPPMRPTSWLVTKRTEVMLPAKCEPGYSERELRKSSRWAQSVLQSPSRL